MTGKPLTDGLRAGTRIGQLNVALALHDFDDPRMAGFLSMVDHVNAAADRQPGFIWRLKDASGKLNAGRNPREIVNLSVWASVDDLFAFVHSGMHHRSIKKRASWFAALPPPYFVMWPIGSEHVPTLSEGYEKLETLRRSGSSEHAFGWEATEALQLSG